MKIDVRYIFGNTLRRNYKPLRKFCSYPLLSVSSTYAGVLGFVGVLLSFYDIIRIIRCGSVLPCSLWRSRIKPGKLVSAECERDLKLVSLVLSLEYYLLLICGSLTKNPILFIPWLALYSFVISLEFVIFCLKIFTEGIKFKKQTLLMSMFVIYNWLSIFCAFFNLMGKCK